MSQADLLIGNVHVPGREGLWDVLVQSGRVTAVEKNRRVTAVEKNRRVTAETAPGQGGAAAETLDGAGGFLSPAFVDAHTHMEKALIEPTGEYPTLGEAVAAFNAYSRNGLARHDVERRAQRLGLMAVRRGTLAMRTHIRLGGDCGTVAVEAVMAVRERLAPLLDIQVVGMLSCHGEVLSAEALSLMDKAAALGVDAFGVAAHMSSDPAHVVDQVLDKAGEHRLPVDFHVDETDKPDIRSLRHICTRMEQAPDLHGKVSAGHLCALSAVSDAEADETIRRMAAVNLHAAVMPSCNLYLMGRNDGHPQRRGVTRVRELMDAGVNVSCASDNVRDHFRPFGNADLLEEGLLLAQVCQLGTPARLRQVFDTLTVNPARMLGLEKRGVFVGAPADLVLLAVSGPEEALIAQPDARTVIRKGRVVYTRCTQETLHHELLTH